MLTQDITYQSDNQTLQAFFARPDGDGPFPGVLVIHEIFGLNDNIRAITRRFAEVGYAALAVDLFSGRNRAVCMARLVYGMLRNSLDHFGVRDASAGLSFLASQPGVDSQRLGAVGYCMGGSLAIAMGVADGRLRAIAPYYAQNPHPLEAVRRSCPVVGSYPEADFTAAQGKKLEIELEAVQIPHDIKIYPGAKHSFFNDQGQNYDPAASEDSWQRVLAFFQQYVG